ncbi:MAG: type I CRISPR-associated protein Cas7 [Candidatus Riflebacteria bacterium]|nr:type I CRISPR-associated protein Cas7 [Candidatus Riflebacteria bacterium]
MLLARSKTVRKTNHLSMFRFIVALFFFATISNQLFANLAYQTKYGLYIAHGFFSPHLATQTGFTQGDLDLLWEALQNMFEHDRSAARGLMATRKLVVFKHESALGNTPAHRLFERLTVEKRDKTKPVRSFNDYVVRIDSQELPGDEIKVEYEAKKKS